jgi:hypothetical protein
MAKQTKNIKNRKEDGKEGSKESCKKVQYKGR